MSEVRYNGEHTHIDQVKVHVVNDETISVATVWKRENVVKSLESGKNFVTIMKGTNEKWKKDQPVYVIKVGVVKFIKTIDNNKASDNLENLPEY
ncbi:MAG: DUF3892 domain-containing protein [Desulfobacteraceae bacterium]|nr:DUF3892 domain-containing protein [Desulfobacteraceae bacterium]